MGSFSCVSDPQVEVEETLKRIQSHKGVIGVIVVNQEGQGCISALCTSSYYCVFVFIVVKVCHQ